MREVRVALEPENPVGPKAGKIDPRLGEWIRTARVGHSLSQRLLAERAELSRSYLSEIERGKGGRPSLGTLDKLAFALGASRTELMRAAGYIEAGNGTGPDAAELQLVALYRTMTPTGRATVERFARFVHGEEHRWTQSAFELSHDEDAPPDHPPPGPTLFDGLPGAPAVDGRD